MIEEADSRVFDADDHFGHRENNGIVVDLFWNEGDLSHDFRVEVQDGSTGVRFFLYPTTGKEAIRAFYHPFATAQRMSQTNNPAKRRKEIRP